jgi:hypothetical protein
MFSLLVVAPRIGLTVPGFGPQNISSSDLPADRKRVELFRDVRRIVERWHTFEFPPGDNVGGIASPRHGSSLSPICRSGL